MKSKYFLRIFSLLALLISLLPVNSAAALPLAVDPPPVGMFQLPWDLGIAWVAIDGLDNGTRRPLNSSHHFSVGGAIDFAPHNNMRVGENTSNFWVAAAASGTVVAKSFCHVRIDHGNGWTTEYQFLGNIQVKTGDSVARNQRLGIIADGVRLKFCPGSSEPNVPHLHFMLRPTLRNATLAGWEINYLPVLSKTTFRKNDQTVGLFKPLLNTFDSVQIVNRGPITWDTLYTGNVDAFRYERWSLTLDELNKFTLTATPAATGLVPLILLLDASGNEITRGQGTLTSTQPAGSYFVQIQPQTGSGAYTLLLQRNDLPSGPFVSTTVNPASVNVGQSATATVRLNNVPAEGYASAEFTCTYNSTLSQVSNIVVADLFGADPAAAINDPHNGSFIVAIAGSQGNKATTDGTAFTFTVTGSQAGQTAVECQARVSQGNNALTAIDFVPGSLTILAGTGTPQPTPGPTMPVETAEPTITLSPVPSTPTVLPSACDRAEFVGDITVPNGTVMAPGATFTKTWRLKNLGPCEWTTSYHLVFFSGDPMSTVYSAPFTQNVAVGQTVDISINLTAPNATGTYRGYWMFRNSSGANFGIGPEANEPWFVEIVVSGPTLPPSLTPTFLPSSPTPTFTPAGPGNSPTPSITPGGPTATPIPNTVYGFAANACAATWSSGAGQLPCPGTDGDPRGFVLIPSNPHLENGSFDSRPGLLTHPQNVQDGYIQGLYPAIHVQNGDRFRALLNCEFGATGCYVAFKLEYQVDSNPVQTLFGPFLERYEGQSYTADIDLSSLAGKDVKFILKVLAMGPATEDRALWVGPVIYRTGTTSTPTPEVTSTVASPTNPATDWLVFTNNTYGFRFRYPQGGQILAGGTDNSTRIDLPRVPGTNLSQKYLQMTVVEDLSPCRSPLASGSIAQTSETVVINGISFLKETGEDGTAGHINKWIAYSTTRNNACVSLDFVLRAANPGMFATPPPLYDEAAESLVFGQIVETYEWLAGTGTSTPTPVESSTPTSSTPDGSPTPTATQSTPLVSPTPTGQLDGTITGKVIASKPVTVSLYSASDLLVTSVTANPDGTFSLTAPAGTYTITASASGFLDAEGSATITGGSTGTKPEVALLAGDIDGNDVVDQFDALTIGMSYNTATPPEADLNDDGVINVLDLELLASSYRKSAPQGWN